MSAALELTRQIPHKPSAVWDALLHPRADHFSSKVNVRHEGLRADGTIGTGSHVIIEPTGGAIKFVPLLFRRVIRPVRLEVEEADHTDRVRKDTVLANKLVEGNIRRSVQHAPNGALVVIEADFAMNSVLRRLVEQLPINASPEELLAEGMNGMLNSLEALVGELALMSPEHT